jgi:hypothetical protein
LAPRESVERGKDNSVILGQFTFPVEESIGATLSEDGRMEKVAEAPGFRAKEDAGTDSQQPPSRA